MFKTTDRFDMSSSQGDVYAVNKNNSFSLKISTAFVLTLLAVAIAIGVGLIVHFAGGEKNVVCQCSCGSNANSDGAVDCPSITTSEAVTCSPCPNITETTPGTTSSTPQITTTPPSTSPIREDVLLPTSLKPKHYNVRLRPNLNGGNPSNFYLEGSVKIYVDCVFKTNNVTLHIQDLNVTAGSINVVNMASGTKLGVRNFTIDTSAKHFLIIEMMESLSSGQEYYIEMDFTGPIRNNYLSGLYYSSYTEGNQTRYMGITQFQSTYARKAFPSFDEPALKATFNITLERRADDNMITLSNMPQKDTVNSTDGYVADIYDETVVMPTYLLAFAVCDFVYKENVTKYNHLYRTYSRREYIDQTNYSLWVGSSVLDAFEDYFDIRYPLQKLDSIAVPNLWFDAMENWGLVTYRENHMFYHPDISTTGQHMYTALLTAHELAHMWLGNLVSPQWWDDVWLNEAFASFFEYLGVDFVEKDWDMMNYIAVDAVQYAMYDDSFDTSKPIYREVWTPNEIENLFDIYTYYKGASVIRMMWFFLGEDIFRRGLSDYLKSKQYGNVQPGDLWRSLTKESEVNGTKVDTARVMDGWIKQKNYPLVNVTVFNDEIYLTQRRFLLDKGGNEQENYLWEIPITFTTNLEPNFNQDYRNITWMNKTEITISAGITGYNWIILNIQEFGYYIVNYPPEIWNAIAEQLVNDHNVIHVVNRAALISDAWTLQRAGLLNIGTALHILDYLNKEREYVPWSSALDELSYLDRMLVTRPSYGNFQRFMIDKVNTTFMEHKLDNLLDQPVQKKILQRRVATRACKYGIKACIDEASDIFYEWKRDPDSFIIAPDMKPTVLCTAIRLGTTEDWDFLFSRYVKSPDSDKNIFDDALSCSTEIWILNRFLEYSIDETKIRPANTRFVILAVASNPVGLQLAWNFVRSRWTFLIRDFKMGSDSLNQLVIKLTRSFYTDYQLKQVESWKANHPSDAVSLSGFDKAIETIKINRAWAAQNYNIIEQWLSENYSM